MNSILLILASAPRVPDETFVGILVGASLLSLGFVARYLKKKK